MNSYTYARNNPLSYNDPDGQWPSLAEANAVATKIDRYNPLNYYFGSSADKIYEGGRTGDWGLMAEGAKEVTINTAVVISTSLEIGMTAGTVYGAATGAAIVKTATSGRAKEINQLVRTLNKINTSKSSGVVVKTAAKDSIGAQREKIWQLAKNTGEPEVERIAHRLFKSTDTVPGGTAGGYKYEMKTGKLLSPKGHGQAVKDTLRWMNNTIPNVNSRGQNLLNAFRKGLERVQRTQY